MIPEEDMTGGSPRMTTWKDDFLAMVRNRAFCFAWLAFGFAYVTWYGFLKNPADFTASMVGLAYPVAFRVWGVVAAITLALNLLYAFRRYGYKNRAAMVFLVLGALNIAATVNIPSTETMGLQKFAHWTTALLFAFCNAMAMGLFLLFLSRRSKRAIVTFIALMAMLAGMIVWLIMGKNGLQEALPLWFSYAILFTANFTGLYKECLPEQARVAEAEEERVAVTG